MKISCGKYLEEHQLTDLNPRLRCISCNMTVAHLYDKGKGKYCIEDGQWVQHDSWSRYTAIDKEGWMCGACLEYEEAEPAAVVILHGAHGENPDDYHKHIFKIGSHVIINTSDDEMQGDLFEEVVKPYVLNLNWHPIAPWRGHYAGKPKDIWVEVIDDWFGTVDGHNCDRGDLGRFYKLYEQQKQMPGFPMMVCFPRTSNVCACGISVFVPRDFLESFKRWLGVDDLEVGI